MSFVSFLLPKGPSGFGYGSTADDVTAGLDLSGLTVVITGSNSGIGLESVRVLAARGATILALARSRDKAASATKHLQGKIVPLACELADPHSVLKCAEEIALLGYTIDVLMLNAGIMALPQLQLAHGIELQFFTNHVGHFLLTTALLDRLSPAGKVVAVSSRAHEMTVRGGIDFENLNGERGYHPWRYYGQSKLANLLFIKELSQRLPQAKQSALAVHPGVIRTALGRHMGGTLNFLMGLGGPLFLKTPSQGAATQCWAAVNPGSSGLNGDYLADCNKAKPSAYGRDATLAARLWEWSEATAERLRKE